MKLKGREIAAFLARPDPARAGLLIYGADAGAVAERRRDVLTTLLGPEAEGEMRLTRLDPATLRADPAALQDALRAQGFFPGRRAVLVEDAGDGLAALIGAALAAVEPGRDAFLLVTADALPTRSKLRKLFEDSPDAVVAPLYDAPPDREAVETLLTRAGLARPGAEGVQALVALARDIDPGSLARLAEMVALYKRGDATPLSAADVAAVAPLTVDGAVDGLIGAVADGNLAGIGPEMVRLAGQGVGATTLCIAAQRHFRTLYAAAIAREGAEAALSRARPPVFGPRRDALLAQVRGWGAARLEKALGVLLDTDLALRSAAEAPPMAVLERAFIRIAMQRGAR